ncbi:MAG: thiamine biosynthesis protein ThiS [Acidobacteria bacterium]|nr:MAG: thiamine biosynthesis protein ThiS [Acidobacteriota bacterium]
MKVKMRNPDRIEELDDVRTVGALLARLGVHPDSVIVIRGDSLLTKDQRVSDDDEIELRPVVSGGAS